MNNLNYLFAKFEHEYGSFSKIEKPLSPHSDLHGMMLLATVIGTLHESIISCANHDIVHFNGTAQLEYLDPEEAEHIIQQLVQCGFSYSDNDQIYKFV